MRHGQERQTSITESKNNIQKVVLLKVISDEFQINVKIVQSYMAALQLMFPMGAAACDYKTGEVEMGIAMQQLIRDAH